MKEFTNVTKNVTSNAGNINFPTLILYSKFHGLSVTAHISYQSVQQRLTVVIGKKLLWCSFGRFPCYRKWKKVCTQDFDQLPVQKKTIFLCLFRIFGSFFQPYFSASFCHVLLIPDWLLRCHFLDLRPLPFIDYSSHHKSRRSLKMDAIT